MSSPSTPCTACTFTPLRQANCSYTSHVKIIHASGDRGVWALGSSLILKDRGPNLPTLEAPILHFMKANTSIPVPEVIESWEEDGGVAMTVMRRVPGEPLSDAWTSLSQEKRERVARRTVEYLAQLRGIQSDRIQSLAEGPVYSNFLFKSREKVAVPHGPLGSDDELWKEIARGLDEGVPDAVRVRLRKCMPPAGPYTFTHGDLTNVNIMVENGELLGIIDWEMAGYLPVWWEAVGTSVADSEEDREWKALLTKYMPDCNAAREFWRSYYDLCRDPQSERAKRFMEGVNLHE